MTFVVIQHLSLDASEQRSVEDQRLAIYLENVKRTGAKRLHAASWVRLHREGKTRSKPAKGLYRSKSG